jgi:hypothetical protein
MRRTIQEIQQWFPKIDPTVDRVTSCATDAYQCVAWAAKDKTRVWEGPPARRSPNYWPPGVNPRTPAGWVEVLKLEGYLTSTQDRSLEPGIEKVAIYVKSDWTEALHVARQLPSGLWTSKLGFEEDIEHATLEALEDGMYGSIGVILQRPARYEEANTTPT